MKIIDKVNSFVFEFRYLYEMGILGNAITSIICGSNTGYTPLTSAERLELLNRTNNKDKKNKLPKQTLKFPVRSSGPTFKV